jgi:PAS domain S-box-containing protein
MGLILIKALFTFYISIISGYAEALSTEPISHAVDYVTVILLILLSVTVIFLFYSLRQKGQDPRLALLWSHVPDIITEVDLDGKILTINRLMEGFSYSDVIGHSSFEFLTDEGKSVFANALATAQDELRPQCYELSIIKEDGSSAWISNTIVPVIVKQKIISLLVIVTDISEQKAAHQILIDSKNTADKANSAKSQFLASMSHEIRTPMTGILGMSSLLEQTLLTAEQDEYVSTIQNSADHLLSIVNDILDISKIEANKLKIQEDSFDVYHLINTLVMTLGTKAQEKGLNLQVFIDDNVPKYVVGDALRIRQILMNYLSNAIKFTMKGHVIVRIVVVQEMEGKVSLRFSVEDSGIGITADKSAFVFDEYTDGHGVKSAQMGGTGLGLNICYRLAHMMSGKVGVASSVNLGSNFWLDLDLAVGVDLEVECNSDKLKQVLSPFDGLTVWIIDDIKINRLVMQEVARDLGFIVEEFNSISDAFSDIYKKVSPDFLVISKELVDDNTDYLFEEVSHLDNAPLIAMTTVKDININYRAIENKGVHAFWEWPIARDELISIIQRSISYDRKAYGPKLITRHQGTLGKHKEGGGSKGKILLAEDNIVNQKVASRMLKKMNFDVDIANNGEEALSAWKRGHYDIILMDCHMPVMNGLQATRMIRMQEDERTPILALSADVLSDRQAECLAAGMDGFISKPIGINQLRQCIEEYL